MYITILVIFIILAVGYVWYVTKYKKCYDDEYIMNLDDSVNKVINVLAPKDLNDKYNEDNKNVSVKLLSVLFNLSVDPKYIAVGEKIKENFEKATKKKLEGVIKLYDYLGIPGEIAIVKNEKVRNVLHDKNYSLACVEWLLEEDLVKILYEKTAILLDSRWKTIDELEIKGVSKGQGGYMYIDNLDIPNLNFYNENGRKRVNMLCTIKEFETLVGRLKTYLTLNNMIKQ